MNPADAAELGIAQGDTVLATSETGKILRPASLTETIMPGVVALPHGNWLDYDEETGIDYGGCDNSITPNELDGFGLSGYSSSLVNIEKWTGEVLPRDVFRPLPQPEMA